MTTTSNREIQDLKEFIGDRFNQLNRKIDTVKAELKQEITEVKAKLKQIIIVALFGWFVRSGRI